MEWISVKDRLPPKNGIYLGVKCNRNGGKYPEIYYWNEDFKHMGIEWIAECIFTYWMPLPSLPEEELKCD